MSDRVEMRFYVPAPHKEAIETAVSIILETMAEGAASNGEGTFWNKDPLSYHVRKGLIHLTALYGQQDMEAREREQPKLKHLYNAVTRLCLAETVHRKAKAKPPQLVETVEE